MSEPQPSIGPDRVYEVRDPVALGRWVANLQGLLIVLSLGELGTDVWRLTGLAGMAPHMVADAQAGPFMTASLVNAAATFVYFVVLVAVGIVSLVWIVRTNRNAHAWSQGMRVSPGWAAGWFFVPIAGLWKPFQGVNDTWRVSEDPAGWAPRETPGLLRAWWAVFLIDNTLGNVTGRLEAGAHTVASYDAAITVSLLSDISEIAMALAFREVVRRITAFQSARITERRAAAPAPMQGFGRGDAGPTTA